MLEFVNNIFESAYIISKAMEVVEMFFVLTSEYIQYLNDPDRSGLTFDQWKEKKKRKEAEKQ